MADTKLVLSRLGREILVTAAGALEGHIKLSIPEFYGTAEQSPFAVAQGLKWEQGTQLTQAEFTLDSLPSEVGIDCHGSLVARDEDVVDIEVYVRNVQNAPVDEAHHTVLLDMSALQGFEDADGDRTFVYTSEGWAPLAQLAPDDATEGKSRKSIWVGANYGEQTVIWRTIARQMYGGDTVVALAMDRGYALAGNHPDWPKGLLGGCRWGTLEVDEERVMRGRIYICAHGLEQLREKYARDFRPS